MLNRDTFSGYHPLVNFLYFAMVLVFAMCFMHPVCLLISLGLVDSSYGKWARYSVKFQLMNLLLTAALLLFGLAVGY